MEKYMKLALKEAEKSLLTDDVPVGAVIIKDGKIIAQAHNAKEKTNIATKHAEIIVIEKACRKLRSWHLEECTLFITLEPCLMCCGAILQSRIKHVVYGTSSNKFGYIKSVESLLNKNGGRRVNITSDICQKECSDILIQFFKNKR